MLAAVRELEERKMDIEKKVKMRYVPACVADILLKEQRSVA